MTLITGRRYAASAARYADLLGLGGPLGVHYGRRIVDHPSGRIVSSHPLPRGAAWAMLATARAYPESLVSVAVGDDLRFDRLPPGWVTTPLAQFSYGSLDEAIAEHPDELMLFNVADLPEGPADTWEEDEGAGDRRDLGDLSPSRSTSTGDGPHPGSALNSPPPVVRAVIAEAERLFPGQIQFYLVPWAGRPRALATALSVAADKGTALLEIALLHGVHPDDTVAMGDSEADVPMLRAAGLGVAMPWSAEEVRREADLVAEGGPEEAVARAIRMLFG
ncbi:MAG: HAD hydrolase family protein [Firmicutes bacterium]|nr:HAD hydrolase family protein [Bacillota bacterium]